MTFKSHGTPFTNVPKLPFMSASIFGAFKLINSVALACVEREIECSWHTLIKRWRQKESKRKEEARWLGDGKMKR